jgi:hypothetical protein
LAFTSVIKVASNFLFLSLDQNPDHCYRK